MRCDSPKIGAGGCEQALTVVVRAHRRGSRNRSGIRPPEGGPTLALPPACAGADMPRLQGGTTVKRMIMMAGIAALVGGLASTASAASLSLSIGSGGLLNPNSGSTFAVAPLATELTLGFNIAPNVTLDGS